MARPTKEGMDYFPHDTDAANDEKIEALRALHGNDGYAFYFIVLERIYRSNTAELDVSKLAVLAALIAKVGVNKQKFDEMLETAFDVGCLDREAYEFKKVLTSDGVKKRAKEVEKLRNKWRKNKEKSSENIVENTVENLAENSQETGEIKLNKTKLNKIKEKETKVLHADVDRVDDLYPSGNAGEETPARIVPVNQGLVVESSEITSNLEFMSFWRAYPKKSGMALAFDAWNVLMAQGVKSADLALAASKYSMRMKADGTAVQFMKSPCNFINEKVYIDYLPHIVTDCPKCKGRGWYVGQVPTSWGGTKEGTIQCDCRTQMAVARGW